MQEPSHFIKLPVYITEKSKNPLPKVKCHCNFPHVKLTLNTKKRLKRAAGQTYLQVAAQTVALQVSLFVLVQFDLVLFGHRVPHHNATLGHHLDKLFSADVRRQTWGAATRRSTQGGEIRRRRTQWRDTKVRSDLATPTWHIDVCVFIVINVEPPCRKRKMTNLVKLTKQSFFFGESGVENQTCFKFPLLPFLLELLRWGFLLAGVHFLDAISWFLLFFRLLVSFRGCSIFAALCSSIVRSLATFLCEAIIGLIGCKEVLRYLEKLKKPAS